MEKNLEDGRKLEMDRKIWYADYVFSPDMFGDRGDVYCGDIALMSAAASAAAYSDDYTGENIRKYLKMFYDQAGFENTEYYHYDKVAKTKEDGDRSLFAIGHRKINTGGKTFNLICITYRGTVRGDWFGNMKIGMGDYHEGFETAAKEVISELDRYTEKYGLREKENNKICVFGHSRGGAVANLVSKFLENCPYADRSAIYGYTIASPNTTTLDDTSASVFNFINTEDFVPVIPYWDGWGRFGEELRSHQMGQKVLDRTASDFREATTYRYVGFSRKEIDTLVKELYRIAPNVNDFYTVKFNKSAKDGGRTAYDVCNLLVSMSLKPTIKEYLLIPNEFNKIAAIMIARNIKDHKIINAHSLEYYYFLIKNFNESLD
ncbi:MAG: hypothetical protein KBT47_04510 [Armatimonadetes bacterium]|nr:hypothetical protein [Candidatus Hippobium faecium]